MTTPETVLRSEPVRVPRGLVNRGNLCYLNATLQCLVHCPPLHHYLRATPRPPPVPGWERTHGAGALPVLRALVGFVAELPPSQAPAGPMRPLPPASPALLWQLTETHQRWTLSKNRQEDAQEFLQFLLANLQDEFRLLYPPAAAKPVRPKRGAGGGGGDWAVVGAGGRANVVQAVGDAVESSANPFDALFCGVLASTINRRGAAVGSLTKQPFTILPLDIHPDRVRSVDDALRGLTMRESIELSGQAQRLHIDSAPTVLTLQLKRWVPDATGLWVKVTKPVALTRELLLDRTIFPSAKTDHERRYALTGVVAHLGEYCNTGHYLAYVPLPAGQWLEFDDQAVRTVRAVRGEPYLLFYANDCPRTVPGPPPVELMRAVLEKHAAPKPAAAKPAAAPAAKPAAKPAAAKPAAADTPAAKPKPKPAASPIPPPAEPADGAEAPQEPGKKTKSKKKKQQVAAGDAGHGEEEAVEAEESAAPSEPAPAEPAPSKRKAKPKKA